MAAKKIDFELNAVDKASSVFKSAGDKIKGEMSAIKQLKSSLGEDSGLGNAMKIAAGAGAVAGLNMAGRAAATLSEKIVALRRAYEDGRISAGKMTEQLLGDIPVLGNVAVAARNASEAIFGLDAMDERRRGILQMRTDAARSMTANAEAARDKYKELERQIRAAIQAEGMIGLDASRKTAAGLRFSVANRKEDQELELDKIQSEIYNKTPDGAKLSNKAQLEELQTKYRTAYEAYEKMKRPIQKEEADAAAKELEKFSTQLRREFESRKTQYFALAGKQNAADEMGIGFANTEAREADFKRSQEFRAKEFQASKLHDEEMADIHSNMRAGALRIAGKYREAALEEINRDFAKQRQAAEDAAKAEIAALTDGQETSEDEHEADVVSVIQRRNERLAALNKQHQEQISEANDRGREDELAHEQEVQHQIAELRISAMKAAGQNNPAMEMQSRRAEIAEQYARMREEIERRLRTDKALTAMQRAGLQERLKGLGKAEAQEAAGLRLEGPGYRPPDVVEGGRLTGSAAAGAERGEIELMRGREAGAREAERQYQVSKRMADLLGKMFDVLEKINSKEVSFLELS